MEWISFILAFDGILGGALLMTFVFLIPFIPRILKWFFFEGRRERGREVIENKRGSSGGIENRILIWFEKFEK
jgi:hypothetical protein